MPFIGNQPALSYTSFVKQDFTTSATTAYTLSQPVANENEIALFINFVRQEPTTAYSASGTSLTLTSATSASDDMYAIFLGKAVQTVNPPAGSVGTSQLVDGAVTSAKLSAGKVLQVVSVASGTNDSTTSGTFVDSSLLASITPSSSSNKILIIVSFNAYNPSTTTLGKFTIFRGNASTGTNLGHATYGMSGIYGTTSSNVAGNTMNYLDSPSTTSSTQYTLAFSSELGNTTHIAFNNQIGSITLMEIAG